MIEDIWGQEKGMAISSGVHRVREVKPPVLIMLLVLDLQGPQSGSGYGYGQKPSYIYIINLSTVYIHS